MAWQGITQLMGIGVPNRIQQILAQAHQIQPFNRFRGQAVESGVDYVQNLSKSGSVYSYLLAALLTLLVGLLIAASLEPGAGNPQSH